MGLDKRLQVGRRGFWNGGVREIVGSEKGRWLLWCGDDHVVSVPKHEVLPVVDEVFAIGDRVRTWHTFTGKVVAFDHARNEAICISEAPDPKGGDRVRWAYDVRHIDHVRTFTFILGQTYPVLHNGCKVWTRAVEDPDNTDKCLLYNVKDGSFVMRVPRRADVDTLNFLVM